MITGKVFSTWPSTQHASCKCWNLHVCGWDTPHSSFLIVLGTVLLSFSRTTAGRVKSWCDESLGKNLAVIYWINWGGDWSDGSALENGCEDVGITSIWPGVILEWKNCHGQYCCREANTFRTKKRPLTLLIQWGMLIWLTMISLELQECKADWSWLQNEWIVRKWSQQVCSHTAEILRQEKRMRISSVCDKMISKCLRNIYFF